MATVRPFSQWGILPGYFTSQFESPDRDVNIKLAMNDGTNDQQHLQAWSDFDRFYSVDLMREQPSGRHYIFICRPDLYLVEANSPTGSQNVSLSTDSRVAYDSYFQYLAQHHPHIIASLTGEFAGVNTKSRVLTSSFTAAQAASGYGNSTTAVAGDTVNVNGKSHQLTIHTFIPYLTSRIESLQLPDYKIEDRFIVQPYTKYSIPYTTSALGSSTGGSFDITFREDRDFSIHKLFYAWIYYQNNVMRNIFKPKEKYMMYNALDYATSIYDFIVDETGENIVYWTKYTGCVPTSVPLSDLSFNRGSEPPTTVNISFSYFFCEHMDLNILLDFQYNSLGYVAMRSYFKNNPLNPFSIKQTAPIYDENTFLGRNFVGRPVVFYTGDKTFKLRWLP